MLFRKIKTPGIAHVAYLLGNEVEALVVDPRRDVDEYVQLARSEGMKIRYVLLTHRQEDFVMGSAELAKNLLGGMTAWGKLGFPMEKGAAAASVTTPEIEGERK